MDEAEQAHFARLSESILKEADTVAGEAAARSITLRLTGSLAVRECCPTFSHLLRELGRRSFRDLDYMGYWTQRDRVAKLFESRGYALDQRIKQSHEFGVRRFIYNHPNGIKVDVFFDELVMAHTIDVRGRLELQPVTLSVVDLLLSKLQIHEITENDLIDLTILLAEHGEANLDMPYLLGIMRTDWGFCYTTLENLRKTKDALDRFTALSPSVRSTVVERLRTLGDRIEAEPKSLKWRLRAKVGTKARWYEEVTELDR